MPVKPFVLPRAVIEQSGIEIQNELPVSPLTAGTEYLPLYLYEDDAFTTLAASGPAVIESTLAFDPFLLVELDTRSAAVAAGRLPDFSDPASYLTVPDGYTLTQSTVIYDVDDTFSWGVDDPLIPGSSLTIRVTATASNGTEDISFDQTAIGFVRQVDPVATAGLYDASFTQGTGVASLPYTDLVGPVVPSAEWTNTLLSVSVPSIAGLSAGSNGLLLDLDQASLQSGTLVDVVFTYSVEFEGLTHTASTTKQITLNISAPIAAAVEGIIFNDDTVYVDQLIPDQINFDTLYDGANYTGVSQPFIVVRAWRNNQAIEIRDEIPSVVGATYRIFVDVYENGAISAENLVLQLSETRVAEALFGVSEAGDATTGVTWSYDIAAAPASSFAVLSLEIDGRGPKPGLTLGDLRAAQNQLVETHSATQPVVVQTQEDPRVGDTITALEPVLAGPLGTAIALQIDLLINGAVSASDITLPYTLTEGQAGASLALRFTYTGAGVSALVVDSPSVSLLFNVADPGYTQRLYQVPGTARFHLDPLPAATRRVVSAWVQPSLTSSQRLFSRNSNLGYVDLRTNGSVEIKTYDDTNALVYRAISPSNGLSPDGVSHICLIEDLSTPGVEFYIDGVLQTMSIVSPAVTGTGQLSVSPFAFFARHGGGGEYSGTFGDLALYQNGSITAQDLFGGGTPPDLSTLSETPLYHFGGDLTAAQINAVDSTQNAPYSAISATLEDV